MKKPLIFILTILLLIIGAGIIWWNSSTIFLKNISANDVAYIQVFDGSTGNGFTVKEQKDVLYIVSNIQNISMKKDKISLGYLGYGFRLEFYNKNKNMIDKFIVNHYNAIRKDPFFYRDDTKSLCFDYLKNLEDTLAQ